MTTVVENNVFHQQGSLFRIGPDNASNRHKTLPLGTYLVRFSMEIGYYLELIPDFELPSRLYGDLGKKAERILNTFSKRPKSTGVLLSGEKGSGKTLLTKLISNYGLSQGMPTLVVNASYRGDGFNTFIQDIEQPCVVLFDEFEKVYAQDEQQELLTLFDGVFSTKKLLLLTTNNYVGLNSHMHNRPGRLYYNFEFEGLDLDFVMEYGEANLKNKDHVKGLAVAHTLVNPMSFDILQAMVEECNRYDESPITVLNVLNVKTTSGRENYAYTFEPTNGRVMAEKGGVGELFVNPFAKFTVEIKLLPEGDKESWDYPEKPIDYHGNMDFPDYEFDPKHLVSFDTRQGIFKFFNPECGRLTMRAHKLVNTKSAAYLEQFAL